MVFTMNTSVFAEEITVDSYAVEESADTAFAEEIAGLDAAIDEEGEEAAATGWDVETVDVAEDDEAEFYKWAKVDNSKTLLVSSNDTGEDDDEDIVIDGDWTDSDDLESFTIQASEKHDPAHFGSVSVNLSVGYGADDDDYGKSVSVCVISENVAFTYEVDVEEYVKVDVKDEAGKSTYTFTSVYREDEDEETLMSNNEIFGEGTVATTNVKITYYDHIPYFGKSIKSKADLTKLLGNITISNNLGTIYYKPVKAKIVTVKNKLSDKSVSLNKYIQITKLEISGNSSPNKDEKKTLKAIQKEVKDATKASKKKAGKLPVTVYPFHLTNDSVASDLSDATLKGKKADNKFKFSFKFKDSEQ
ncbi:MAG: hypothetical protein IJ815_01230, partial [Lachnospiraceae bacterium]|nr:hypothetical protein [Lachnospiraceae bacterium]